MRPQQPIPRWAEKDLRDALRDAYAHMSRLDADTHIYVHAAYVHSSLRMYMCIRGVVLGRGNLHTAAAGEQGQRAGSSSRSEGGSNNHTI